jgi:hypothetical protein
MTHMFKKIMVGGVAAAAIAAAGIVAAGPAGATAAVIGGAGDHSAPNYRDELRYAGISHEDAVNAADLGSRLCAKRYVGYSEEQLILDLAGPGTPYNTEESVAMVLGAEFHFCPGYLSYGSGSGSSGMGTIA